jgi:hypothetical protein
MAETHLPIGIGDSIVQGRFIASHEAFVREFPNVQGLSDKMFKMTLER